MIQRVFAFLFVCTFLGVSMPRAHAQQYTDIVSIESRDGEIQKDIPTVLTLESPSIDLGTALITWTLDGEELARGIGKQALPFTFTDTLTHVFDIHITDRNGFTRRETESIRATDIDLLWEAQTLVPQEYRGRALPTPESELVATCYMHTKKDGTDTPNTLVYTWKFNGQTLKEQSGIGKQSLHVTTPAFRTTIQIEVIVHDITGAYLGKKNVYIPVRNPYIVLYEKRPLIGLWIYTTMKESIVSADGVTISAFPYFMSAKKQNDPRLVYTWRIPETASVISDDSSSLHIVDQTPVSISVVNKETLLQNARTTEQPSSFQTHDGFE